MRLLIFGLTLFTVAITAVADETPVRFPASVVDVDGNRIDVTALATDANLVVVTLKAVWCPVCQQQLVRLVSRLPELTECGVTFLVLAPGTPEELRAIRARTGFDYPFIADPALEIADALDLRLAEGQILPCIFEVTKDRAVGWRQLGRNGAYFGDGALRDAFDCVST